jgi:hypothetical protein
VPRKKDTVWPHPPAECLQAFACGALPEERAPEVEAHLAQCAGCCEALGELPEDGFVARLRQAYQTTAPAGAGAVVW